MKRSLSLSSLVLMIVIELLTGCGGGGSQGGGDTVVNPTGPSVLTMNPAQGATDVPLANAISVVFSDPVDSATIASPASNFVVFSPATGAVSGNVTYDPDTKTATFTPTKVLAYNTQYTATVSGGVKDKSGNPMGSNFTWNFTSHAPKSGELDLAFNGTGM